ncbi:MAG: gfo/Idh/MocA family oxidoreductase, partial [Thermoprotei archaeon]
MKLGIGLLGAGFMGKAHSHAYRSITTYLGTEVVPDLVAIYSRNKDRARNAMKRYGYRRFYTEWRDLIRDEEIEVIDNSLPNFLHKEPSIEAIELGKHVTCEKPLARNLEEALEMVRAANRSGVTHGVIFNKRWFPGVQLAKKLLREQVLGKVTGFRFAYHQDWGLSSDTSSWRFKRELAGYGVLGDQGSHVIDLVHFLIGKIRRVLAKAKRVRGADVEDYIVLLTETKEGAVGTIEVSRVSPGRKNYLIFEIYGEEGSLYFNMERLNELWIYIRDAPEISGFR